LLARRGKQRFNRAATLTRGFIGQAVPQRRRQLFHRPRGGFIAANDSRASRANIAQHLPHCLRRLAQCKSDLCGGIIRRLHIGILSSEFMDGAA
jgi:glutathione S-transferase